MISYQIIRTHSSPYHGAHFEQIERDRLEALPGLGFAQLERFEAKPTILITNTHTDLSKLPSNLLSLTKLILHSNSGYDRFADSHELWKAIPVVVGHEIRAQAVAEYTLSCLFQGLNELPQHLSWDASRKWDRPLIKNQLVHIYGFGHIGKIVAATLHALGADVQVADPFVATPFAKPQGQARIVIACCSLNKSSKHLFNQKFFSTAHPELIFINGARGKLVEETALREFLLSHPSAQAFLDVFENEPFDSSWYHFPQVWKTSHIAGVHLGLDEDIIRFEEKVLKAFLTLSTQEFKHHYEKELLQNKWLQGELI